MNFGCAEPELDIVPESEYDDVQPPRLSSTSNKFSDQEDLLSGDVQVDV